MNLFTMFNIFTIVLLLLLFVHVYSVVLLTYYVAIQMSETIIKMC